MDCGTARQLISAWVDGEVMPGDEAESLRRHIEQCDGCRQEKLSLERVVEALRVPPAIEPCFTLADVREASTLRRTMGYFGWLKQVPRWATAATVAAALAVGSLSGAYYGRWTVRQHVSAAVTTQQATEQFGLEAFSDGLAEAVHVADARVQEGDEVTQ